MAEEFDEKKVQTMVDMWNNGERDGMEFLKLKANFDEWQAFGVRVAHPDIKKKIERMKEIERIEERREEEAKT